MSSLTELDALVGKHLTGENPLVYWINTQTEFQFDSVEEALDAMSDPFFRQLQDRENAPTTVLMEVRVFRRYSAELSVAWEIVELLSHCLEALLIRRDGKSWEAAFGDREYSSAPTPPAAICLAALRTRGVEVECRLKNTASPPSGDIPGGDAKSLYSRP